MENIALQAEKATRELIEKANLKAGDLLVVGCSSSEIVGSEIGGMAPALKLLRRLLKAFTVY